MAPPCGGVSECWQPRGQPNIRGCSPPVIWVNSAREFARAPIRNCAASGSWQWLDCTFRSCRNAHGRKAVCGRSRWFATRRTSSGDTVQHLLDQGVAGILVADNGSVDGTAQVIRGLNDARVYLVDDREPAFFQAAKLTELARRAAGAGADWIVPFDGDEFWFGLEGSLIDSLRSLASPIAVAHVHNAFPSPEGGVAGVWTPARPGCRRWLSAGIGWHTSTTEIMQCFGPGGRPSGFGYCIRRGGRSSSSSARSGWGGCGDGSCSRAAYGL